MNDYNAPPPANVTSAGWFHNGGISWQSSRVSFTTLPAGQSYCDPAVASDSSGAIYLGIIAASTGLPGVLVSKSTDGGMTFGEPIRLDTSGDKPYVAVDPGNDAVYCVWENQVSFNQAIYISKSTNHGTTFPTRKRISTSTGINNCATPFVGPNGEVYVTWGDFGSKIRFQKSVNGGTTWLPSDATIRSDVVKAQDPLNGNFRNSTFPVGAVDAGTGP